MSTKHPFSKKGKVFSLSRARVPFLARKRFAHVCFFTLRLTTKSAKKWSSRLVVFNNQRRLLTLQFAVGDFECRVLRLESFVALQEQNL